MQSVYQTIMLNYNNKQWIVNYMERSGRDPFSGRIWVMPRKLFRTARLCCEIQLGRFLFITINFGIYTGVSIVLGKTRDWRLFHFIVTKFEFSRSSQTISFEQILYKRLPVNPLEKKTGHQLQTHAVSSMKILVLSGTENQGYRHTLIGVKDTLKRQEPFSCSTLAIRNKTQNFQMCAYTIPTKNVYNLKADATSRPVLLVTWCSSLWLDCLLLL